MTMLARIQASDIDADRRRSDRRLLTLQVPGSVTDRSGVEVVIHDLSHSGLLIETAAELAVGARLAVELPEAGRTDATVVWCNGGYFGCRFEAPIAPRALSAAQLMSPPAPVSQIAAAPDVAANDDVERLPLPTRLRIIGALALGAWALVIAPFAVVAAVIS